MRSKGKDKFYIPGGKIEQEETKTQALIREVKEELGVHLIGESIQSLVTIFSPAHGHAQPTQLEMACFKAEYLGQIAIDSEIEEMVWVGREELALCAPAAQLAITHLYNNGFLVS